MLSHPTLQSVGKVFTPSCFSSSSDLVEFFSKLEKNSYFKNYFTKSLTICGISSLCLLFSSCTVIHSALCTTHDLSPLSTSSLPSLVSPLLTMLKPCRPFHLSIRPDACQGLCEGSSFCPVHTLLQCPWLSSQPRAHLKRDLP